MLVLASLRQYSNTCYVGATTLCRIAFRSDAKTIPDIPYVYTRNAIFGAVFGTERLCSAPLFKVVRFVSDGLFELSIAFNMESRGCLCVILVGLLRTILGYIVQSQQLIVFFNKLASWRRRSVLLQVQIFSRRIILCLSRSAVYIILDKVL